MIGRPGRAAHAAFFHGRGLFRHRKASLRIATDNVACCYDYCSTRSRPCHASRRCEPPYAPEIQAAVRPHHARRAAADAVSRHRRPSARLGEIPRRQPARPRPLSLREREIVIDRTCALTGCEYEWGVHVAIFAEAAASDRGTGPRHRAGRGRCAVLVGGRAGADRGGRCAARPRDAERRRIQGAVGALRRGARSSRSSCCAASIAPCRIWRTGWRCRWRRRRRGFRVGIRIPGCEHRTESRSMAMASGLAWTHPE